MPGLISRLLPWRRGERGGVAIIATVILSSGVVLGCAALVVDIGQIWAEREQLQSGAQGAALAVAKDCARTETSAGCATPAASRASTYANGNAKDSTSTVTVVCGRGGGLPTCPPQPDGLSACMGDVSGIPTSTNYVEVRTSTRQSDGSSLLPPTFARALAGNDAYQGKNVNACARAAWGPPKQAASIAVTISTCEWNQLTSSGAVLQEPPPTVPPASAEGVIRLHGSNGSSTCAAGPSGWDAPGGFGWLDETGGDCATTVAADGSYPGDTGASSSGTCQTMLSDARTNRTALMMPIYDGVTGTGSNTTYHIAGLSGFVITGYSLPGFSAPSWLSGDDLCHGSDKCLYGYFTTVLTSGTTIGTGVDYGASIVTTIG